MKLGFQIKSRLKALLSQGATPNRLAASLAVGVALGLFPLPFTTYLCLAAGALFGLNHPALQLANWGMYPLQLPGMVFFVIWGNRIFGHSALPAVGELGKMLRASPLAFARQFGWAVAQGVAVWAVAAPLLALLLFFPLSFVLRKAMARKDLQGGG